MSDGSLFYFLMMLLVSGFIPVMDQKGFPYSLDGLDYLAKHGLPENPAAYSMLYHNFEGKLSF